MDDTEKIGPFSLFEQYFNECDDDDSRLKFDWVNDFLWRRGSATVLYNLRRVVDWRVPAFGIPTWLSILPREFISSLNKYVPEGTTFTVMYEDGVKRDVNVRSLFNPAYYNIAEAEPTRQNFLEFFNLRPDLTETQPTKLPWFYEQCLQTMTNVRRIGASAQLLWAVGGVLGLSDCCTRIPTRLFLKHATDAAIIAGTTNIGSILMSLFGELCLDSYGVGIRLNKTYTIYPLNLGRIYWRFSGLGLNFDYISYSGLRKIFRISRTLSGSANILELLGGLGRIGLPDKIRFREWVTMESVWHEFVVYVHENDWVFTQYANNWWWFTWVWVVNSSGYGPWSFLVNIAAYWARTPTRQHDDIPLNVNV